MTQLPPAPARAGAGAIVVLALGIAFTGIAVVLGGVFTLVGGPVWDDWLLDARGVEMTVTPTDFPTAAEAARPGSVGTRWHRIEVEIPGTPPTRTRLWADEATVSWIQRGKPVVVEVDPGNPHRARLPGQHASFFGNLVFIPVGFALPGVPLLGLGAFLWLQRRAFLRNAEVVRGEVVEVTSYGDEGSTQRVVVSFPGPSGPTRGTCLHNDPVAKGAAVWVAFDRRTPTRCEIVAPAA